nr:hypothetical protein [Maliibacterium massiliense]
MKHKKENFMLFCVGAVGYYSLEVLWRGYSHWSMALTGGTCLLSVNHIQKRLRHQSLATQCVAGALCITGIEFVVGCLVNKLGKMHVWDYSDQPLNVAGQICPQYFLLWCLLCLPIRPLTTCIAQCCSSRA